MKPRGKLIYSVNEGNAAYFDEPMKKFLQIIKNPTVSVCTNIFSNYDENQGIVTGRVCH